MSIDALTAIENFASGIFSAGMEFLFTWGELLGIIGLIGHLMRARAEGRHSMGPGKFIAGIFICGMLVSLPSMINAGGTQMGFRADSFAP
ncbi:TPA: conjugal transfer protein TraQ, partial [Escherichia coli]|nr:conjugal transfer protein TraQ [Escherichia coli]